MKAILSCTLILMLILSFGCSRKVEPIPVGDMNTYRDPGFGFKVQYPKEWINLGTTGKAVFARSQEVLNKFLDPRTGEEGGQVTVEAIPLAGRTPDAAIQAVKDDMKQIGQLGPDSQMTLAGKPATKVPYTIQATKKTNITGYVIFVPADTALFRIECEGYGEQYDAHAAVFTAMVNSFEPPVFVPKKSDTWAASPNLETYTSAYFTMKYPDNLNIVSVSPAPKHDFAMEMRADRQDCGIHIDVFGAQKLTVEKVWEQNKATYRAKSSAQTQIDGQGSVYADYSPRKDISSRVYFVVKNDKVIRITINYFTPQKDIYFTAFEAMVKSLKLK